jgi:hypothetical protein
VTLTTGMWQRAQTLVAVDAETAHREMGCCYPGAKLKRHRPYSLGARASMMVEAIGSGDPHRVSDLIVRWNDSGMLPGDKH